MPTCCECRCHTVRSGPTPKPNEERFWASVHMTSECWEWRGSMGNNGYGVFYVRDGVGEYRHAMAHRFAYEQMVGPIADGFQIDHLCRNRACIRPEHLEAVTPRENTLRSPDAPAARNAAKTHCLNGHPLSGYNLMLVKVNSTRGYKRVCRACSNERGRRYYARRGSQEVAS